MNKKGDSDRSESPTRLVFAPDLFIMGFIDPDARRILELWRDGHIRPVVTRSLLKRYLKILDNLGVPKPYLDWWVLWLTAPEKSLYLETDRILKGEVPELCLEAARAGSCIWIISKWNRWLEKPGENTEDVPRWIGPTDFLSNFKERRHGIS